MNSKYLAEDKRLQKLAVRFSEELIEKIDTIRDYNRGNENLVQLYEYIDGLRSYISNPVVAWDNTGKYQHNSKKETHLKELGYDVIFTIKINKATNTTYIYVLNIKLNILNLGLEIPQNLGESKHHHSRKLTDDEWCNILLER